MLNSHERSDREEILPFQFGHCKKLTFVGSGGGRPPLCKAGQGRQHPIVLNKINSCQGGKPGILLDFGSFSPGLRFIQGHPAGIKNLPSQPGTRKIQTNQNQQPIHISKPLLPLGFDTFFVVRVHWFGSSNCYE